MFFQPAGTSRIWSALHNSTSLPRIFLRRIPLTASLLLRNQIFEVPAGIPLSQALDIIDLNPESVLAILNGELITEKAILAEGDQIRLVYVISGG